MSNSLWPLDCSSPGSSVRGILRARIVEWVAVPSSRGSSWPLNRTQVFCVSFIVGGFFTCWTISKALKATSMTGNWTRAVAVKALSPSPTRPPGNCNREVDATVIFHVLAPEVTYHHLTIWEGLPGDPGLGLCAPNAEGLGWISGQGTRSHVSQLGVHMLQLKIWRATTKSCGKLKGKEKDTK